MSSILTILAGLKLLTMALRDGYLTENQLNARVLLVSSKEITSPSQELLSSLCFLFFVLLYFFSFFLKLQLSLSLTEPNPHRIPPPFISFPPHMLPHSPLTHKTTNSTQLHPLPPAPLCLVLKVSSVGDKIWLPAQTAFNAVCILETKRRAPHR